jgi:hypothetical protein
MLRVHSKPLAKTHFPNDQLCPRSSIAWLILNVNSVRIQMSQAKAARPQAAPITQYARLADNTPK